MSDICESCGCPEGVDGHDVLYRQIDDLKKVANVCEAIGTMDADERDTLCQRIKQLEDAVILLWGAIHTHHGDKMTSNACTWESCIGARIVIHGK